MKTVIALVLTWLLLPAAVHAQMETEQSRQSLIDIRGFYVKVDVEGSVGLTSDEKLNISAINSRVKSTLRNAGLNILEPTEIMNQPTEPYLYVHVNMLEMEQGLVPFAVATQFFQRVALPRGKQGASLVACTWDDGLVGLVSYDNLDMIADSAVESVGLFIDDFQQVNP